MNVLSCIYVVIIRLVTTERQRIAVFEFVIECVRSSVVDETSVLLVSSWNEKIIVLILVYLFPPQMSV
jgi:hypothetical protein